MLVPDAACYGRPSYTVSITNNVTVSLSFLSAFGSVPKLQTQKLWMRRPTEIPVLISSPAPLLSLPSTPTFFFRQDLIKVLNCSGWAQPCHPPASASPSTRIICMHLHSWLLWAFLEMYILRQQAKPVHEREAWACLAVCILEAVMIAMQAASESHWPCLWPGDTSEELHAVLSLFAEIMFRHPGVWSVFLTSSYRWAADTRCKFTVFGRPSVWVLRPQSRPATGWSYQGSSCICTVNITSFLLLFPKPYRTTAVSIASVVAVSSLI